MESPELSRNQVKVGSNKVFRVNCIICDNFRWNGIKIDVTTSHFATYTNAEMENVFTRKVQARETVRFLEDSSSDLKVSKMFSPTDISRH